MNAAQPGPQCLRRVPAVGQPGLLLERGDYLMFHMDHAGVQVKGEMQVVLTYALVDRR